MAEEARKFTWQQGTKQEVYPGLLPTRPALLQIRFANNQILIGIGFSQSIPFVLNCLEAVNVMGMAAQESGNRDLAVPVQGGRTNRTAITSSS